MRVLCVVLQEMAEQKKEGGKEMLQLLNEVSGAFQPGILTALVGVSGAGKTTLMDVLAGRKTGAAPALTRPAPLKSCRVVSALGVEPRLCAESLLGHSHGCAYGL